MRTQHFRPTNCEHWRSPWLEALLIWQEDALWRKLCRLVLLSYVRWCHRNPHQLCFEVSRGCFGVTCVRRSVVLTFLEDLRFDPPARNAPWRTPSPDGWKWSHISLIEMTLHVLPWKKKTIWLLKGKLWTFLFMLCFFRNHSEIPASQLTRCKKVVLDCYSDKMYWLGNQPQYNIYQRSWSASHSPNLLTNGYKTRSNQPPTEGWWSCRHGEYNLLMQYILPNAEVLCELSLCLCTTLIEESASKCSEYNFRKSTLQNTHQNVTTGSFWNIQGCRFARAHAFATTPLNSMFHCKSLM